MNRRQFLAGTAILPALSLSGCTSTIFPTDHPLLNCLELMNLHDEPHTIHVRVDFDGEEVVSHSYQLDAKQEPGPISHEWVAQTWPDQPGRFRIRARIDDETDWKTFDSEGRSGDHAYSVWYRIDRDEYGAFWGNTAAIDERESQCENAPIADDNDSTP